MTYRVIVTGCRDWDNQGAISLALTKILTNQRAAAHSLGRPAGLKIVHGACYPTALPDGSRPLISVDWLAELWCRECTVSSEENFADWKRHGNAAGPIRNRAMAVKGADLCLAFWDGKSSGTLNMISEATKAGIPVRIVPKAARS